MEGLKLAVAKYLRAQLVLRRATYSSDGYRCAYDVDEEYIDSLVDRTEESLMAFFTAEEWALIHSEDRKVEELERP